jgi:hypothetical protein
MKGSVIMIRAGTRELIYDRVDRVLQFQNLAFYIDGIFSDKSSMATAVVTAAMIFCASGPHKRSAMHPRFARLSLGLLNSAL